MAREMLRKHPGLTPAEIGARMRAEIPSGSAPEAEAMVERVVERLAGKAAGVQAPPAGAPGHAHASPSVVLLVAANLLPLYGVLAWDWQVFPLLVLFWMENVVVGVLNALKMLCADPSDAVLWIAKAFLVPFFCVHYGMFALGHGAFVFSGMFGGGKAYDAQGLDVIGPALAAARDFDLWLPLAVLAGSHAFSFLWNYLYRGEFRRASVTGLMMKPYARVVVLHLTIIFGGMAALALGSPLWALALLVAIKVTLDVLAHAKEHRSASGPRESEG